MNRVTCIALCLVATLILPPAVGAQSQSRPDVTIAGITWFDDNRNGMVDRSEDVAPNVTVELMIGDYAPHGEQPHLAAEVVSDYLGHFEVTFKPEPGEPAYLWPMWALRPAYPYSREAMIVPSPSDYIGYNYAGSYVPIPLDEGPALTMNLPLLPLAGVLDRLPNGGSLDFPIPAGHFFTQANGLAGGSALGYGVTNAGGIPFWDTWLYLGGVDNVGYPISERYEMDGYILQAFQKAIFQWKKEQGVSLRDIYDELHDAHLDAWLKENAATPLPLDRSFDAGKSQEEVTRDRLALLDADPAIKERYFSVADPEMLFGLPTSAVIDFPQVAVIRTQRTVLQHWKVDVPWAKAGQVTLANGGDIMKVHAMLGLHMLPLKAPPSGSMTVSWLMGWSWRLRSSLFSWIGGP